MLYEVCMRENKRERERERSRACDRPRPSAGLGGIGDDDGRRRCSWSALSHKYNTHT